MSTEHPDIEAQRAEKRRVEAAALRSTASHMSRAERRARGHRGGILPLDARRQVAREQGVTPQIVTAAYLQHERRQ